MGREEKQLARIADTLDDYMEMSLAAQEILVMGKASDPELGRLYQPIIDALDRINVRRAERTYEP